MLKVTYVLSPPQRLPLGIPIKQEPMTLHQNNIIEKIASARGTMGRGKRRPLVSLPPSHRAPRAFFLSPQPPHNTKRPLRRRETYVDNKLKI